MDDSPLIDLPAWVCRRDGRVVPFEPDAICQSIFLAGETIQQPNAFLAREMTDGVLHFLALEHAGTMPTTQQIGELVVKVLRELGQAPLAQAFAERNAQRHLAGTAARAEPPDQSLVLPLAQGIAPAQFAQQCQRLLSRHAVFSRDIQAAQDEGYLSLAGLEHPAELAGGVASWSVADDEGPTLLAAILKARQRFGGFVVLDAPEHAISGNADVPRQIRSLAAQLRQGLEATGLEAIVNLNAAEPPPWAQPGDTGPLFPPGTSEPSSPDTLAAVRQALLDALLGLAVPVRIDWHLGAHDFGRRDGNLALAVQAACQGRWVSFVFDRPSSPLSLAEGVDRRRPAVLQVVGLHLTRLATLEGLEGIDQFLRKLLHLAQMAVSVGVQKRRFLKGLFERGGPAVDDMRRGFFLDRAPLCVVPVGLPAVVRHFSGQGMAGKQGLSMARQIVEQLGQHLRQAGRTANLDAVLDSPWWKPQPGSGPFFAQPHLAGLTCAEFAAAAEEQLRCAGSIHQLAGAGTAVLLLPADRASSPDRLTDLLQFAWKKAGVVRVRLERIPAAEPVLK